MQPMRTDVLPLRDARKSAGLTQEQLGELLGRSQGAVSSYEVRRAALSADLLDRACDALELSDADARRLLRWAAQARPQSEAA